MQDDFISWQCPHVDGKFCPPEGCSEADGCALKKKCKYGDPTCPCQDGDMCHYEGDDPMSIVGTKWRRVKTGHEYIIMGTCTIRRTKLPGYLYRLIVNEGETWVHDKSEFLDGRFERIL